MSLAPDRLSIGLGRFFTTPGVHPYDEVAWEKRDSRITNWKDGSVAFEQLGVEFPVSWSLNSTNIVAQKYFRGTPGTPERESSMRQVIDRVADTITDWGVRDGYFTDDEEAEAFRNELKFILLHQRFRSATLCLIIMGNIPLALVGSVAALWISGLDLDLAALIGFIAVTGVAVRNSLLKVSHFANMEHPMMKKDAIGANASVQWPTGIGAKGNEGVAGNVAQLSGSIGYVEYAYAKQNHLAHVKMLNKAGQAVEPTVEAFRSAASNADWNAAARDNFYIILVDQPGAQSWPITATTYILMYKNPADPKASQDALKFFQWSLEKGDQLALGLDYVPLPENAVKAIVASWKGIQGSGM